MDLSSRADPASAAGRGARARPSEVTFLLFVGGLSAWLGALLVLQVWGQLDPSVPYFLLASGFGVLVVSADLYLSGVEKPIPALRAKAAPRAAVPSAPANSPRELTGPAAATHRRSGIHLHGGLDRADASVPRRSVEDLWAYWTPLPTRPLGVETVGPVPETAYSPPRSGGAVAFPERDRDLLRVDQNHLSSRESSGLAPPANGSRVELARPPMESVPPFPLPPTDQSCEELFSEAELEVLFPRFCEPDSEGGSSPSAGPIAPSRPTETQPGVPVTLTAPPSGSEQLPSTLGPAPSGPLPLLQEESPSEEMESIPAAAVGAPTPLLSGPVGLLPSLDSSDYAVIIEAANPTPPHLRGRPSTSAGRLLADRAPSGVAPTALWHCAECSSDLCEFRAWVECPRCSRPVCRSCLARSYLAGANGCCSACAAPIARGAT